MFGRLTLTVTMLPDGQLGKDPFESESALDGGRQVTPHDCARGSECSAGRALPQGMHVLHVQDAQRLRQLPLHME